MPPVRVLYISYDGALDPLGRSQVLPYLEGLAARGYAITLISFEKPDRLGAKNEVAAVRALTEGSGITWKPLRYHKRWSVAATAYDIAVGLLAALRETREPGPILIHARSYVAGLIGLLLKRLRGGTFIFDMRGFWVDERVDGGLWQKDSLLYPVGKRAERSLFREADAIVSLTESGSDVIRDLPYLRNKRPAITVIPACVTLTPPASTTRSARSCTSMLPASKSTGALLLWLASACACAGTPFPVARIARLVSAKLAAASAVLFIVQSPFISSALPD